MAQHKTTHNGLSVGDTVTCKTRLGFKTQGKLMDMIVGDTGKGTAIVKGNSGKLLNVDLDTVTKK